MILGQWYLSKSPSRFSAFNRLQVALIQRFLARGGTVTRWMEEFAPIFRRRYAWLCDEPRPVPVVTGEHRVPPRRP